MVYRIFSIFTLSLLVTFAYAEPSNTDCFSAINDVTQDYMQHQDKSKSKSFINKADYEKKLKDYLKNTFIQNFDNKGFTLNNLFVDQEKWVNECNAQTQ